MVVDACRAWPSTRTSVVVDANQGVVVDANQGVAVDTNQGVVVDANQGIAVNTTGVAGNASRLGRRRGRYNVNVRDDNVNASAATRAGSPSEIDCTAG